MLLTNARIATLANDDSYGLVDDGAIAIKDTHIAWVGPRTDLPAPCQALEARDLG